MNSSLRSLIAILLFLFTTHLNGQFPSLEPLSGDTLFAGQRNVLRYVDPGVTEGAVLLGKLAPAGLCGFDNYDTIITSEVYVEDTVITVIFDLAQDLCTTWYQFFLSEEDEWNTVAMDPYLEVVSRPYFVLFPEDVVVCYGEEVKADVQGRGSEDIQYQWYLNGLPVEGAVYSTFELFAAEVSDTGWYHCIISNDWGTDSTGFRISLHPLQENVGVPDGVEQLCMGGGTETYTLPEDPLIDTYFWRLLPAEAGTLQQDGRSVQVEWDPGYAGEAWVFAETGYGECSGPGSDTLRISLAGPSQAPEICIVGVDEASGYYRVVWNKLNDQSITAYHIFRESNQAGVFLRLSTIEEHEFSVWIDSSSAPDILPHAYRISYTDTCGNESPLSDIHRTIHLSANLGTGGENNLAWTPYEGFAFLSYSIYRGAYRDSMELLQQVPSSILTFTDRNPPSGEVFYQIEVTREGSCMPARKGASDYSVSRSNVFELTRVRTGMWETGGFRIYPNPASERFVVSLNDEGGSGGVLTVIDLTGKQMAYMVLSGNETMVYTTGWPGGIYIVKVDSGDQILYGRVTVQ